MSRFSYPPLTTATTATTTSALETNPTYRTFPGGRSHRGGCLIRKELIIPRAFSVHAKAAFVMDPGSSGDDRRRRYHQYLCTLLD